MNEPSSPPDSAEPKPALLERREVLKRAGLALAGLVALGLVAARADPNENDDEQTGNTGVAAVAKGVVDLGAVSAFAPGSVTDRSAQAGVQVSRTAAGLIALSPVCTHQGCTVKFSSAARGFLCPCHGARFAPDGQVIAGPARAPLSRYALSIKNGRLLVDTNRLVRRTAVKAADFVRP
jgi:cytochrome b6-f complex iron-sulfur subunit